MLLHAPVVGDPIVVIVRSIWKDDATRCRCDSLR